MSPSLCVVVKGWPRLSETFIAQELVGLEGLGLRFELWSLRHPTDVARHPLHAELRAAVKYLPEYLHQEPVRVLRAAGAGILRPGFLRSAGAFLHDLWRDPTRNRVRRFGQALVLAREAPQAVGYYAHFLHTPASVARYAAMLCGTSWSFSAHAKDIWTTPDWELRDKMGGRHAAKFGATCTAYGAARLRELSRKTPIDLIYHGLDLDRFPPPPPRPARSPGAALQIVSVGRLVEKKGFDRLLCAFALLPERLDWHWTHIGGGPLADKLRVQASELALGRRITWRGPLDQSGVLGALRQADLFVLPSRIASDGDRDGLPNVLMEAASQRVPILSAPVAAIPEFVEDGATGRLAGDGPADIASAIQNIADNPEAAAAMAERALERLKSDFSVTPGLHRLEARLAALRPAATPP